MLCRCSLPACFELGGVNPVRWGGWCWPCLDAAVGVGFSVGLCALPEAHIPGLSLPLSQAGGPSLATILPSISQDPKQTARTLKRKGKDGQPLPEASCQDGQAWGFVLVPLSLGPRSPTRALRTSRLLMLGVLEADALLSCLLSCLPHHCLPHKDSSPAMHTAGAQRAFVEGMGN